MNTYILKYDVYNSIDFTKGTVVKIIKEDWANFEVTEGSLKGKKGSVADGLDGWLLECNEENRLLFSQFKSEAIRLEKEIEKLNNKWDKLPTVKLT